VEVDVTWPKAGKDEAWPTKHITEQCKQCPLFIQKSLSEAIRQALENDPQRPLDFCFPDNYLGICTLHSTASSSKRPARNTPEILFPSSANYIKCQALGRSKIK